MAREITCDKCGIKSFSETGFAHANIQRLKKVELSGEVAKVGDASSLVIEILPKDICPTCIGKAEEAHRQADLAFFGLADDKE